MADSRNQRFDDGSMVDWTREPEFEFADEVDALETLQELGDELQKAREHVRQITRYLHVAVVQAKAQHDCSKEALIRESGLARQTVYTMLGAGKPED